MNFFDNVVSSLNKDKFHRKEVVNIINGLKHSTLNFYDGNNIYVKNKFIKIDKIKLYDVIGVLVAGMPHPGLVLNVKQDVCYIATMSTKPKNNVFKFERSRMFTNSYLTSNIMRIPVSDALEGFVMPFDNIKEARSSKAALVDFHKQWLK